MRSDTERTVEAISIHAPREGSDSNISQKEHAAFVRLRDIAQNSV